MNTLRLLFVTMCAVMVLVASISYAAPACCDPAQAQNTINGRATTAGVSNGAIRGVAPKAAPRANQHPPAVMSQIAYGVPTQAKQRISQQSLPLSAFYRPAGATAARAGGGCCAGANSLSVTPLQTAVPGCGGACPSCFSKGNVAKRQVKPSVRPNVPQCCSRSGSNFAPAVQTQSKAGGYAPDKTVAPAIRVNSRPPEGLTANPSLNRPPAARFVTLW